MMIAMRKASLKLLKEVEPALDNLLRFPDAPRPELSTR